MATCLLRNLDDIDKADMQSATVLLGLTPTIISYIGPTVVDITLVSSYRPVLATLTGLGAPAIFPTRLFKTVSPEKRLEQGIWKFALENPAKAFAVTAIEYLFLGAAIVNSLLNSRRLGHRTILSWKCLSSDMEFLWNFLPLVSYICAGLSLRFSKVSCYTIFLKKINRSMERKLSISFLDRPEKVILLTQHRSENNPEEYIKLEDVAGSICKTRQA